MKQLKSYVTLGDTHDYDDDALQNKIGIQYLHRRKIIGANT
jgi:hypothetical protein